LSKKEVTDDEQCNAQNPLHTFPRVNKSLKCNLGNDTTQQTQRTLPVPTCYRFVVDLLWGSCQLVMDLLWGNWCNGFWP